LTRQIRVNPHEPSTVIFVFPTQEATMRTTFSVAAALCIAAVLGAQTSSAAGHPVTCNDGTTDVSTHKGACGKHGGIKAGPGAVAVNAAPAPGAVKVNTPGGTPTAAPMATKTAPVGVAAHTPAPAPSGSNKLVPPASAPVNHTSTSPSAIIGPLDSHAASPRDPATHSSPRDATVSTKSVGATAKCKDGTYSHSTNKQLQCAGHTGVAAHLGASSSH
jgi:hypothetical protein